MKKMSKEKQKRGFVKDILFLGITLVIEIVLLLIFPEKKEPVISSSKGFLMEMILILPAVMILMGLFAVFVPNDVIVKYLGRSSGIKGIFLAILMGAFPTGPLYVAFPIAAALLKKGARISNIIAFLSAWACIKIPQELVELQFLGLKFMITRLLLTVVFVIIMGIVIEQIILWSEKTTKHEQTS
ncbi:hypothetical protein PAP_01460 [Palaeococcus pacificus DY20341]|uniref:Permease n=1 Tax=Palaeococcus pacificus DY20341 TaxID=1343739 RepID=A0A075LS17_9EURY|nr:permease [Palaeococcus pacificus]AIF68732.1 hypothetical protein PAP_01460 [Palaeococcus pacificus DY20341]